MASFFASSSCLFSLYSMENSLRRLSNYVKSAYFFDAFDFAGTEREEVFDVRREVVFFFERDLGVAGEGLADLCVDRLDLGQQLEVELVGHGLIRLVHRCGRAAKLVESFRGLLHVEGNLPRRVDGQTQVRS